MQKITPNLWFDDKAEEAVELYTSVFGNSKTCNISRYGEAGAEVSGMPKGSVMTVEFQLEGQDFVALNGGPVFKFTPAVSFFLGCKTEAEIDRLWQSLVYGGSILMEFGEYPFAEKYGWLQDKYGLSWQLILASRKQVITPSLMFVGEKAGKAEEAISIMHQFFQIPRSAE